MRHAPMSRNALRCWRDSTSPQRSRNSCPCWRKTSATSSRCSFTAAGRILRAVDGLYLQRIEGAGGGVQASGGDVEIAGGGPDIGVAEQNLNGAQVGTGVQHVGGAGVAEQMGVNPKGIPARRPALAQRVRRVGTTGWPGCCLEGNSQSVGLRQR